MGTIREGGRLTIGDREFVVPKATLSVARAVAEVQRDAVSNESADGFLASAKVLHLLLVKAAPDLTLDEVLDLVVVDELGRLLAEAQRMAGFIMAPPGEAARP